MAEKPVPGTSTGARRCLPVREWPQPDRAAWDAAHRRGGLLDDDGLAASWSPHTSDLIARGYGTFLAFLAQANQLDSGALPATRTTRLTIESYVAYLRERNHSSTVAARILELIRCIAVMAPTADLAWLRRIAARLRRMARPARDDRTRIVPAVTLCELSLELMNRAETLADLPIRKRALLFRDGLMIAILCICPLRARSLTAMSAGKSLQRRGDIWWVCLVPDETKNRRHYEMPLPTSLAHCIDRYLDYYRPQLGRPTAGPATGALWISNGGKPLTPKSIRQTITVVTRRELGRVVNPQLFRKIVPTELAIRHPARVGIAQPILGHASYATTQSAYNLGRSLDAAKRHHAVVQLIRASRNGAAAETGGGAEDKSTDRLSGDVLPVQVPSRRGHTL
jgi:integrase/recombinase XerD